jgi:hypothetical protein
MNITPELIEASRTKINMPQYYEPAEVATPKHILFAEFIEKTEWKGLPKLMYYIIMDKEFSVGKAPNGDLGYKVTLKISEP